MEQSPTKKKTVEKPASYRWVENGHILLWLMKDTFWAMEFKLGAIFMVVPTVLVAIYILWRSRGSREDIFHNLAVCMWISGNSIWMLGEFFKHEMRPTAVVAFSIGLVVLAIYYIFFFANDRKKLLNDEL